MTATTRMWMNMAGVLLSGAATVLITELRDGEAPADGVGWAVLISMIVVNSWQNVRAWMTATPEQSRAIEQIKQDAIIDGTAQVPPK